MWRLRKRNHAPGWEKKTTNKEQTFDDICWKLPQLVIKGLLSVLHPALHIEATRNFKSKRKKPQWMLVKIYNCNDNIYGYIVIR